MITLAIALAAAPAARPAPELVQCRMMECSWSRPVFNEAIRSTPAGVLRKVTAIRGTSVHRDDFPTRFEPSVPIEWEKTDSVQYVYCSRSQPALAFRSGRRWVAHALDLFDLGGYQVASAVTYLRACHDMDYQRPDIERALRGLGYRPGTRSEQAEIERPEQLPALPRRAAQ